VANSQATVAAKAATGTIPIVFVTGADPVQVGFVASLNQPGGNLTGLTSLDKELGPKRLQLLHELIPNAGRMAALLNPTFPGSDLQARDLQAAASTLGLQLHVLQASTEREVNAAFEKLALLQAGGLVIGNDHSSTAGASSLPRWRFGTPCPQSTNIVRSLRRAD